MEGDDGKRLQACLKRLELQCKAKPKIGGCQGERPGAAARFRMTESAFELARSDWSCCERRSLKGRGFGGNGPGRLEGPPDFSVKGLQDRSKIASFFDLFFDRFWVPFWLPLGSLLEPFGRPSWAKFAPKRLLERLFFQKGEFSRNLIKTKEF